jgi:hypothetical protein
MKIKSRYFSGVVQCVFAICFAYVLFAQPASASTVTLTPATGVAGQTIVITGTGFDNTSAATILWDGVALTTTPSTVTTSASGAIPTSGTVSFIVPSNAYGAHTVKITTGASNVGVATFTVNAPAVAITSPTIPTTGIAAGVTLNHHRYQHGGIRNYHFLFR